MRTFKIPCAHAPALSPATPDYHLSPLSAAEEIGYTFLPSVLVGLNHAPQFIVNREFTNSLQTDIWADEVDAVIVPANACGSSALLSLSQKKCQIITVTENKTLIQVTAPALGIKSIQVNSYLEATGLLVAHKAGINPYSLTR